MYAQIEGTVGSTPWMLLDNGGENNFQRGGMDSFYRPSAHVGTIKSIQFKRDSWGVSPNWCLNAVNLYNFTDKVKKIGVFAWYN